MTVTPDSNMRPEFRAHLEWQIASALRREERFAEPVSGRLRPLRTLVAVLAALIAGAGVMAASGQVQESRQREALIEAQRTEESLSRMRLELAETEYRNARQRFDVGIVGRDVVQAAEAQLTALKRALARLALNAEEIKATAQPPRDDLQAPLVGQRDFVTERLNLDLLAAQQALTAAEQARAETKKRVDVGLLPAAALEQAKVDVHLTQLRLQELSTTVNLRQQLLAGAIKAEALAAELRRLELSTEMQRAQAEFDALRVRVDALRTLFATGQATELDLKRTEVELLERKLALEQLRRELAKIKR
jgi:outer membrane protein TolC